MGIHGSGAHESTRKADNQEIYEVAMEAITERFGTPFLGRVDFIGIARFLGEEQLHEVLEIQINQLIERMAQQECLIGLFIDDSVKDFIVQESLDKPEQNARILLKKFKHHIIQNLKRLRITAQIKASDLIKVTLELTPHPKVVFYKVPYSQEKTRKLILPPTQ